MRIWCKWLVLSLALGLAAPALAQGFLSDSKNRLELRGLAREVGADRDTMMLPMADGVRLATDLYLPDGLDNLPTILVRLPYSRLRYWEARHWVRVFAPQGYAVVVQDMRGRWDSEGVFAPYDHAVADGSATLDWIVAQSWSNGRVATVGCSALGEHQLMLAAAQHPALTAIVPMAAGGAAGHVEWLGNFFAMFEGGVPQLAAAAGWFARLGGKTGDAMAIPDYDAASVLPTLPIRDAVRRVRDDPTDYEALLDGFRDFGWQARMGYLNGRETFTTPALVIDTWFDQSVHASFALSRLLERSVSEQHMLVGPGNHCDFTGPFRDGAVGDLPVAPDPDYDSNAPILAFLDHHLKGAPAANLARYRVYELGSDTWRDYAAWPPAEAPAHTISFDRGALGAGVASDHVVFRADPLQPVPTLGGPICCTGNPADRPGPIDQRPIETRPDLAVFTTPPLQEPLRIAGPISARLAVSLDVPDADLVVRLTEVFPDGRSIPIQEGALRLRYRNGFGFPGLLPTGETAVVTVSLRDTARQVAAGNRLRLHVAASSFPRLARNMQGGAPDPHTETEARTARIVLNLADGTGITLHSFAPPRFVPLSEPG